MRDNDQGTTRILIRDARTARGLTQAQVAAALGCSRSAVATWETTGGLPRPDRLRQLAELLGVAVAELLPGGAAPSLRRFRMVAGLRQLDVSRMLRVATSTYCDVETGRQRIPERWIPLLAASFCVSDGSLRALSERATGS
ncbi:helix-turn-helix transcriptional regulator [Streptomyces sp. H10-C2]|uniref:helix-turn-helix domain-containing protein n=1 Tax=unclassified Streptomyces TaxID=2593676 RepID=UPI0024B8DD67|nr:MULTISPECIES: helix-turn-helix transcriptional regulator [unclassified Streptomyces]MDJ0345554.1 helix-turn-helix transcriptional regulator [Streptomyces sp. PH10-H1]MDJ0374500.1 helix-turn-helix transcriptional regulator [Streptomyces sp. H10-C2]